MSEVKTRSEIMKEALDAREQEDFRYQIEIDLQRKAVEIIDAKHADVPHLIDYRERLNDLLTSSLVEQSKAKILLEAIKTQIED